MWALLVTAGCSRSASAQPGGGLGQAVITGTVRGADLRGAIEGRAVDVVNVDTNEKQQLTTGNDGRFRLTVKPGTYRVELALRDGESLIQAPGVMVVAASRPGAHADFVVGITRASRPRGPAYRNVEGLGSPIA
jgi:hypothetical protein